SFKQSEFNLKNLTTRSNTSKDKLKTPNAHSTITKTPPKYLRHIAELIDKLHLGHIKLLQNLLLLNLLASWQPSLFLPLIKHHLLHHRPRLPIQVAQLALLRLHFPRVDLRSSFHQRLPPRFLVIAQLCQKNRNNPLVLQVPERFPDFHRAVQLPFNDGWGSLDFELQGFLLDLADDLLRSRPLRYRDCDRHLLDILPP
ncbi:hypothetical protein LINGRAHAP2_LOCUS6031, partial [Linum grandiflorum]